MSLEADCFMSSAQVFCSVVQMFYAVANTVVLPHCSMAQSRTWES